MAKSWRLVMIVGLLGQAAGLAGAQRSRPPAVPAVDPYTRADPAAMKRAGYVSFGPFAWGDDHDTTAIERLLGNVELRWLETAHFKLGSSLPAYAIPPGDGRQRAKIRAELRRLARRLPRVVRTVKVLDPWLRLHLFAARLEETYADFARRLEVTDADFPAAGEVSAGEWMGKGPYLGMPAKYTVLLLRKESSTVRYFRRYLGADLRFGQRYHFAKTGTLLFAIATEFSNGTLADDTNLHCSVVFNVVHNLVSGYRYFQHDVPVWFKAGLGQWYLRRIDPHWNNFNQMAEGEADVRNAWDWERKIYGIVKHGNFTPARMMLQWLDFHGWKFADHMMVWSRVDYLMSLGDQGLRVFLHGMKEPFHKGIAPVVVADLLARQRRMLRRAWGLDAELFDERWKAFVLEYYRPGARRRRR